MMRVIRLHTHYFASATANATLVASLLNRACSNIALKRVVGCKRILRLCSEKIREYRLAPSTAADHQPLCSHVGGILRAGRRKVYSTKFKALSSSTAHELRAEDFCQRNIFSLPFINIPPTAGIPRHVVKMKTGDSVRPRTDVCVMIYYHVKEWTFDWREISHRHTDVTQFFVRNLRN